MAVFPENMERLNLEDVAGSLRKIENYIRYMSERVEFSNRNMTRSVTDAGMTTVEVVSLLQDLNGALAALQSAVSSMQGAVNTMRTSVEEMGETVDAMEQTVETVRAESAASVETVEAMQESVTAATEGVEELKGLHKAGTYNGDGSSTERIVDIGAGSALLVYDASGIMAIVTAVGMHYMSSTTQPTFKDATIAAFANGKLTLNTTSYINVNGRTYNYQVL